MAQQLGALAGLAVPLSGSREPSVTLAPGNLMFSSGLTVKYIEPSSMFICIMHSFKMPTCELNNNDINEHT